VQYSDGIVISAARFTVRREKHKELVMTLDSLAQLIRSEKGCKTYRVFEDEKEDDALVLISEWESLPDWDRHVHSEHFTILKGSVRILGNGESLNFKLMTPGP
jgi:quinol monooxygenase YgiN